MSNFVLDEFLPYQLAVVASRISRAFSDEYRRKFGITIPEWRVVAHLSQEGAVSVREIHARVDMDKSKVSRAASKLEAAGYVTKRVRPDDKRLVELSLTDKGRAMIAELAPLARKFEAKVMQDIGKDAEAFRNVLARLKESEL